jgi:hypothetical protein
MAAGDHYRDKAAAICERARTEKNFLIRAEYENLARSYLRLATQADRNAQTDVVYEMPKRVDQHQAQQQQQPQPDRDDLEK